MNENMRSVLSAVSVVFMGLSIFCLAMEFHTHTANVAIHVTRDSQATITAIGDSCGGLSAPCGIHPNEEGDNAIPLAFGYATYPGYVCAESQRSKFLSKREIVRAGAKFGDPRFGDYVFKEPNDGFRTYTCVPDSFTKREDRAWRKEQEHGISYGDKIVPGNGSETVKK